jgi:creatinine amidohydrolase
MTWPEIRDALDGGSRTVVVGVGSIEQHGPHLPVVTDSVVAQASAAGVAARLPGVLLGPTLPVGVSPHHMGFPGTLTLTPEVFRDQVSQCVASLGRHGVERVLVVSGHGGNFGPLAELRERTGGRIDGVEFVPYDDLEGFIGVFQGVAAGDGISAADCGSHAGEWETSLMLALRPDLVEMDRAEPGYLGGFDGSVADRLFSEGTASLAANGVLGDPRAATAERGQRYLGAWIDELEHHFVGRGVVR